MQEVRQEIGHNLECPQCGNKKSFHILTECLVEWPVQVGAKQVIEEPSFKDVSPCVCAKCKKTGLVYQFLPKEISKGISTDELLLDCVRIRELHNLLRLKKFNLPAEIDSDVLKIMRLVLYKYSGTVQTTAKPLVMAEMSKVLRAVMGHKAYAMTIKQARWFLNNDAKVGFIRGWREDIYVPNKVQTFEGSQLSLLLANIIVEMPVVSIADIEERIPRTIRLQRGAHAHLAFKFSTPDVPVAMEPTKEPIHKRAGNSYVFTAPTRDLAMALLLLGRGGSTVNVSFLSFGDWRALVLLNAKTFAIFNSWTHQLGTPPGKKK